MMPALVLALVWKSALIAGLALLGSRAMRGRPAAERVFLLRVAVAMLLTLPIATLLLPALRLAVLPPREAAPQVAAASARLIASTGASPSPPPARLDDATLLIGLYLAGAAALLLHLGAGIGTLVHWTRRAAPVADPLWQAALDRSTVRLGRPMRLLVAPDLVSPLSWGVVPAWILIDSASLARGTQADAVIAHEAAHIRRFDWPVLIATRVAVALFWPNPLIWLLARALARESEIAADEAAVRSVARTDYAQALLAFVKVPAGHRAATGMALWPSALGERIARVVEARIDRRASRGLLGALLLFGAGATPVLGAIKLVRAAPAPPAIRIVAPERRQASVSQTSSTPAAPIGSGQPVPVAPRVAAGDPPIAADPAPVPAAAPVVPAAPVAVSRGVPAPETRIVGRTGAVVQIGPSGTALIGAPEGPTAEELREVEEAKREALEQRHEAAMEVQETAAELREQADELESSAGDPDQDPKVRAAHATAAKNLRAQAEKLDAEARSLLGPP